MQDQKLSSSYEKQAKTFVTLVLANDIRNKTQNTDDNNKQGDHVPFNLCVKSDRKGILAYGGKPADHPPGQKKTPGRQSSRYEEETCSPPA